MKNVETEKRSHIS